MTDKTQRFCLSICYFCFLKNQTTNWRLFFVLDWIPVVRELLPLIHPVVTTYSFEVRVFAHRERGPGEGDA